ncbi:MAG: hypothetical protein HY718_17295 [Planctomycetes bacterium]|nr:hypothetical protein [Planctomycetota bacterium]
MRKRPVFREQCASVGLPAIVGLLGLMGVCVCQTPALAAGEPWTLATPWTGPVGVHRSTADIMAAQAAADKQGAPTTGDVLDPPPRRVDRTGLPTNPKSPEFTTEVTAAAAIDGSLTTAVVGPFTTGQTVNVNYNVSQVFPPDTMGAVGPSQFLVAVNGRIRVFDKTNGAQGTLDATLDVFFDAVRNGAITRNPRVRYDRLVGRWIVTCGNRYLDGSNNITAPNRILIAVSDTGTLSSGTVWTFFYFRQDQVSPAGDSTCLADYATLGVDANALYIGVNQFCGLGTPGTFNGTAAFVVRKSSLLGGGPIVVSAFRNLTGSPTGAGPYTPQGVDNYDPAAAEGYFIGVDNATFGTLMLRRIGDPGGTPAISANIAITVASTYTPILVPHLGNTGGDNGRLDSLDDRLYAAHLRNGSLWTAHNIGATSSGSASSDPSRVAVRWYELQDLGGTPFAAESGTLYDSNLSTPLYYWIPSVVVSGQGHAAFGFTVAGSNSRVDAGAAGKAAGGSMSTPVKYTGTLSSYNPAGDPGGPNGRRWGSYSFTSLDPVDDMTVWTIQEFTAGSSIWGVRGVLLKPPGPRVDDAVVSTCGSSSTINVNLTGSGLYDPGPGAGFNRLSATVSGSGVTVTSVTYNSPASVGLTLSVGGSFTPGSHTITVTNPDGQIDSISANLFVPTTSFRPDFNGDCRVDTADLTIFIACATGPERTYDAGNLPAGCTVTPDGSFIPPDFDEDGDIDAIDFARFQRCISGTLEPVPGCEN